MGESERRRRRLRPPSSSAPTPDGAAAADAQHRRAEDGAAPTDPPVPIPGPPPGIPNPATPNTAVPGPPPGGATGGPGVIEDPVAGRPQAPRPPTDRQPHHHAERAPQGERGPQRSRPGGDDREVEQGLRGLVGSGSSQVSVGAALRARDAARPTDEQLADADANLVVVRRNWTPREDLPRNR